MKISLNNDLYIPYQGGSSLQFCLFKDLCNADVTGTTPFIAPLLHIVLYIEAILLIFNIK